MARAELGSVGQGADARLRLWRELETLTPLLKRLLPRVAPPGSMIHSYLGYTDALETARLFDLHCALWLVSSLLGSRVQVVRGAQRLRLNLYVLLVAPSGVARKSTAVSLAGRIWEQRRGAGTTTISQRLSPEKVNEHLREGPHAGFVASELVSLLGRTGHTHLLPALLTDLYDCPGGVYPTLLSATAPDWLSRSLNPDAIGGGFGSRVLVTVATRSKRLQPWPEGGMSEDDFVVRMGAHLDQGGGGGVLSLTQQAQAYYKRWYTSRDIAETGYEAAFDSRIADHAIKLGALLALARGDDHVARDDLRAGIDLATTARTAGASVLQGAVPHQRAVDKDALTARVLELTTVLEKRGSDWISQGDLTLRFGHKLNARGLRNILDVMHDLRMVQRMESVTRGPGKGATLWRGTTLLLTTPVEVVLQQVDRSR